MDYREYRPVFAERVLIFIASGAALSVAGVLFYDTPLLFAAAPAVFFPAAKAYSAIMAEKRRSRLRNMFRDLLDSMAASFAGGRHMYEALSEAEKELGAIYEEDDEILCEIRYMIRKMDDRESDVRVISEFAERSGIDDIEMFAQVFGTCCETGGDLISAMTETSSMLADKIKIENEIRSLTSQKKTEGIVISVMPVMIIVFLRLAAPEYIEVLYRNITGILLMTAALAADGYAYYLIRKITEIEV